MTQDQRRLIRASLVAPLAAPCGWWAYLLLRGHSGADNLLDALAGLALIAGVAAPFAYGAMLVGLALVLGIHRWSKIKAWHPLVIGAAIGGLVFPLVFDGPAELQQIAIGLALGAAAGAVFWALWRPRASGAQGQLRAPAAPL